MGGRIDARGAVVVRNNIRIKGYASAQLPKENKEPKFSGIGPQQQIRSWARKRAIMSAGVNATEWAFEDISVAVVVVTRKRVNE